MVPPARGNIPPQICPRKIWIGIRGSEPRRKKLSTLLSSRVGVAGRNGTGVAGDLLAHLISGMWCVLGINEIPKSPPWGYLPLEGRTQYTRSASGSVRVRQCSWRRIGSKFRCMRSTPTEMQSMSENDFECFASTGVKKPVLDKKLARGDSG